MLVRLASKGRTVASAAVVIVGVLVLSLVAAFSDGFASTDLDLNDGGVWVTRTSTSQLGHLNAGVEELDGDVRMDSTNFDVLQDGDDILAVDEEGSALSKIDPGSQTVEAVASLPADASVALGGGHVAIVSGDGDLWILPTAGIASFDATTDPLAQLGAGAAVAIGLDGTVHAVSPRDGEFLRFRANADDADDFGEPERSGAAAVQGASAVTITVVGEEAVALDTDSGELALPGASATAPEGAVLQQVGDASDSVMLSTATALISQPLRGGEATERAVADSAGDGAAVAPVQLRGCVWGVWPADGALVRECDSAADSIEQLVSEAADADVRFRVNRGIVVLNDIEEGASWLVTDQVVMVDNWDDLLPPPVEEKVPDAEDSLDDLIAAPPPPTTENQPPVATDDEIGARPGRATIAQVVANDSDPDGDVLTVELTGTPPDGISIAPVMNDSRLQVQIPDGYSGGSFTVGYRISDGRGGTAEANATILVRGENENAKPEPLRRQAFTIEQGATFEIPVLADWQDPDGDDLLLVGAESASGDSIHFTPNGRLLYTATGAVGTTELLVRVSDGTDEGEGSVLVNVVPRGDAPPQANADFVSTVQGRETEILPLLNDYSPSGEALRLASVTAPPELTVSVDRATGSVRIVSGPVGSHTIDYVASMGPYTATARIRVDIRTSDQESDPVAVHDVALLVRQGEVLVDLLANDVDPAGGVLVVQTVTATGVVPVTYELLERRMLRIVDSAGIDEPLQLEYAISNGSRTTTGTIGIVPVDPPSSARAPVAVDDTAVLREGDVTTIDVLANDFSPDASAFELDAIVATSLASDAEGVAVVSGDKLRVHVVEGGPSSVSVTYEIVDRFQQRATAQVQVQVIPRDASSNQPPTPQLITARVLAGSSVRIAVPVDGVDPDGDGVSVVGYDSAPDGGRIAAWGPDFIEFEAFEAGSGVADFTYRVRDRWGAEASASIVIGIAQPADVNQPPFARPDAPVVRPGRVVEIAPIANDSDPDGDALDLDPDGVRSDAIDGLETDEERDTVTLVAPETEGVVPIDYVVADARGATTPGTIVARVDPEAPLVAPFAADDVVANEDAVEDVLAVPVLDNDLDPDGDVDDLDIAVVTGAGRVVGDAIEVEISDGFQIVTYQVTDIDGQTGTAFIFVPPRRGDAPRLASADALTVTSGESRTIELDEWVTVSSGAARLTRAETVTATFSNGLPLVVDENTLQFTSADDYHGDASISFEVADGDPGLPETSRAMLTIPIVVLPATTVAPTFNGLEVRVVAGESVRTNLAAATTDPDPGDLEAMRFEHTQGSIGGVGVRVEGQELVVDADLGTAPGLGGTVQLTITDPDGLTVAGTVAITVVASSRPLAITAQDEVEAVAGETVRVPVLRNDFNPFEDRGPLTLASASVAGGAGSAAVESDQVAVTSAADFSGVLTVRYTVQDQTGQISRQVIGTVLVTVKGPPGVPARPNVSAVGDGEVTLAWGAPSSNGAPITSYLVQGSGVSQDCPATTCVIAGLQNGSPYSFTVTAVNEVGSSEPSPPSEPATPDVRPDPVAAPNVTRGDGSVDVQWAPPSNRGSTIIDYIVEISPAAPSGGSQQVVQGTSMTWSGLANGTAYTFRVQARNSSPEPGDFGPMSAPVIPAGPPMPVPSVTATRDTSLPGAVQIFVSWQQPNNNGADITGYTVTPLYNGQAQQAMTTQGAGATQATFSGAVNSGGAGTYSFVVTATNDVGTSAPSAPSAGIRDVTTPGVPTNVTGADNDGASTITFVPGSSNGARTEEIAYEYQVATAGGAYGGPAGRVSSGGQIPLSNHGGPYTVQVRAVVVVDGVTYTSGWSAPSNQIRPFGKPPPGTASVVGHPGAVEFRYATNGTNGRPLARLDWLLNNDPNAWTQVPVDPVTGTASGSFGMPREENNPAHIRVRVYDVDGNASEDVVAVGYALPPP